MTVVLGHSSAWQYWKQTGIPQKIEDASRLLPFPKTDQSFEQRFHDHVPKLDVQTKAELCNLGFNPDTVNIFVVDANNRRAPGNVRCHVMVAPLPPNSIQRINNHVFVASPELLMIQMAANSHMSLERLILLGYGLCGKFSIVEPNDHDNSLVQIEIRSTVCKMERYLDAIERSCKTAQCKLNGIKRARRALKYVLGSVESPQEARMAMLEFLSWNLGGNNVQSPLCNGEIHLSQEIMKLTGRDSFRGDFVWEEQKVVLEYNGAFHGESREVKRDAEKYNALKKGGYELVLATCEHIYNKAYTDDLANQLRLMLGQRAARPRDGFEARQTRLRNEIGANVTLRY